MKRSFFLYSVVLVGLFSGCAETTSVDTPQEQSQQTSECLECNAQQKVVAKKFVCTAKTKVVNYRDKCKCSYTFPVTVREKSNCKNGDAL